MDSKTTIGEVKKQILKFVKKRGWNPDARSLAISVVLEAGELLEHFQWKESVKAEKELKVNIEKKRELEKEFGDVLFYYCELANRLGIDISEALKRTIKINEEKYPADGIKRGGDTFYFAQKRKYREGRK